MLQELLTINATVSALFGFSIVGGSSIIIKSIIKAHKNKQQQESKRFDDIDNDIIMLKESNRAMLHGKLFDLCVAYIKRGYIKPLELRNINYLYKSYRNLNGNGTIEMLMKDISELPVKEVE